MECKKKKWLFVPHITLQAFLFPLPFRNISNKT